MMLMSPCVVFKACDTSGRSGADAAVPRISAPPTGIEARTLSSFSCVTAFISSENNRLSWAGLHAARISGGYQTQQSAFC
jgi:hypothetical protein